MNNWYARINGQQPQQMYSPQNPLQRAQYVMNAVNNPAVFVKQQFPDIPENIQNNPNEILAYLQRTRGISDQQIQQLFGMYGRR